MICRLKCSIVDWDGLNVFRRGTVLETVKISDQNIHLADVRNTDKILRLLPEDFMNEDIVELLEGGV